MTIILVNETARHYEIDKILEYIENGFFGEEYMEKYEKKRN